MRPHSSAKGKMRLYGDSFQPGAMDFHVPVQENCTENLIIFIFFLVTVKRKIYVFHVDLNRNIPSHWEYCTQEVLEDHKRKVECRLGRLLPKNLFLDNSDEWPKTVR
jgi:hypothetical protein